jgi:hypothetical protein
VLLAARGLDPPPLHLRRHLAERLGWFVLDAARLEAAMGE